MAKQRNSLGLLVLPVLFDGTWEEYKEATGIDLDKIVKVINTGTDDNPRYAIFFKEDFRKLIALSFPASTIMPCVSFPTKVQVTYNASLSSASTSLRCYDDDENGGYSLTITADRTIFGGEL